MDSTSMHRSRTSGNSEILDSSTHHSDGYIPMSRQKSESLKSRISLFDNKKPAHLPVKAGSPVVSREKITRRFSPSFSLQQASSLSTKLARSVDTLPFSENASPRASGDDNIETIKDDTSSVAAFSGEITADDEGSFDQDEPKSENARLQMFEQGSQDAIDDNSVHTGSNEGTRNSSQFKLTARRESVPKVDDEGSDLESSGTISHDSPQLNVGNSPKLLTENDDRGDKEERIMLDNVNAISFHDKNKAPLASADVDVAPVSPGTLRSWKVKKSAKHEILRTSSEHGVRSVSSLVTNVSDIDETFRSPLKKSWKPKRVVPPVGTDGFVGMNGALEQERSQRNGEDLYVSLNDTEVKETNPKKSWKFNRSSSMEVHSMRKEEPIATWLPSASDHTTERTDLKLERKRMDRSLSTHPSFAPTTPLHNTPTKQKNSSLQDRINMFNGRSSPTPQKTSLSSRYMEQLVQKRRLNDEANEDSGTAESPVDVPEVGDATSSNSFTDDNLAFDLDMTERKEPKMSLDRAAVKEKKNIKRNRTKRLDRRGQQKGGHSALIKQKNKDKNAVFASIVVPQDDLSDRVLPEFMKDSTDKRIIVTALRKNFVFEDMDDKEIDKLVAAMEEVQFAAGKDIITQGEEGDYFYVVGRGEVAFFIDGQKIGTAGPGNAFGELALLYTCPRSATVRTLERTTVFRTDQKVFTIMTQSETKKSEEEKRELLRKIPFLSSLGAEDINRLASLMGPVLFSTGDYIVRKGDQGSSFFIIRNGKARVTEIFVGGTSYEDISLEEGDYFGEDALVSDEPRAANVVALTKGSAFAIERESVWKVLGDFGSLISKTQDRKKLESIKIFRDADLSSADFDNLAKLVTDKAFAKGDTICRRKEMVEAALYIVREGAVKITPKDKQATEIIKCGGAFGQDQLLARARMDDSHFVSTYTAKVLEDCVCGVLTLDDCRTTFDTSALGDRIFSEGNFTLEKKRAAMRQLIQSNIKYEDLDKDRIIGTGQFGTVWLVRADPHKTNDKSRMLEFALKVQFKEDPVRRQGALEAIKREMTVLRQLNHPFIIDLVDTYETGDQLMMLTEPVKGGELWSRIHREDQDGNWTSGMPEKNAKFYALVIADVVSFMHRQHIIFRDLKPENVLIDEEGYPALCDFGFAKYCPSDETATFCGTPNYLAPEIVLNRGHGAAVDHWALGVVTYEMITGENPFYYEGQDQMALLQAIVQEDFYPLPGTASNEVVRLISGLLEKEPVQRLGSLAGGEKGILKHPWFSELDINQIRNKKAKAPDTPIITSK